MTGPEHYAMAERLLAETSSDAYPIDSVEATYALGAAQVHATLALVAASESKAGFVITEDDVLRCDHGAIICNLCNYGRPS